MLDAAYALPAFSSGITLVTSLPAPGWSHHPHFRKEEARAQRSQVTKVESQLSRCSFYFVALEAFCQVITLTVLIHVLKKFY